MRAFACPHCGLLVFFENTECLRCGTALGFDPDERELRSLEAGDPAAVTAPRCANDRLAGCNWLVTDGEQLCRCCRLTRTRPDDGEPDAVVDFADTEAAKRRLVFQLLELDLPIRPAVGPGDGGLAFDLLSSEHHPVTIGHRDGLITIDVSEIGDARREAVREQLGEPYRTMLGHLRHEVGHYYWSALVEPDPDRLAAFRSCFGDERADYGSALDQHYGSAGVPTGATVPPDWAQTHVSAYATVHPWEDWAETFAHYLHILDTLQTAAAFGMVVTGPDAEGLADEWTLRSTPDGDVEDEPFAAVIADWLPLTYALNAINRSMGLGDLYPFVLPQPVIDKLAFVQRLVHAVHNEV